MSTLVGIGYSPWSVKARWALDHHGVAYQVDEYTPVLGALPLRFRMRKWRGRLTVPVYFDETGVYDDSLAIARHAESIGRGDPLFPLGADDELLRWHGLAERIAEAGRALTTAASLADEAALLATLPKAVARLPGARTIGKAGARNFIRKYHLESSGALAAMDAAMAQVAARLAEADTLLDRFSYADIAVAVALQFVQPVDHPSVRLGAAARRCWTQPTLVEQYGPVLAWRDALFATRR